jgi:hypothetical protein
MVVNFKSIDETQFRMFPAERLAHIQGDSQPETIAGRLALELFLFRGPNRTTKQQSYLAQVRLKHIQTGATKDWGAESTDPNTVLLAVDQFDVCRLLPDELSAADRDGEAPQLKAYFERSRARLANEAKQKVE